MWSKTQFLFPSVLKVQIEKFHGQFWLAPEYLAIYAPPLHPGHPETEAERGASEEISHV